MYARDSADRWARKPWIARQPLVTMPAAGSEQVTKSLITSTLNEDRDFAHVPPALPGAVGELVIVDGGLPVSAAG